MWASHVVFLRTTDRGSGPCDDFLQLDLTLLFTLVIPRQRKRAHLYQVRKLVQGHHNAGCNGHVWVVALGYLRAANPFAVGGSVPEME